MDFNYFDQLDGGYPWWMEARTFVDDEGFNVQPQPHQPQPEEFPTYSTTIHSDEFSYSGVGQEANYLEFEVPIVGQPTASWSENVATYVAAQYDEAPAPSSMSAVVHVNNSGASTNHSSSNQPSALTSSSSNKRKLEEQIGCFSIHSDPKENRRKRQAFDQETRKKVAVIRKVGSCSRCKARRVKCDFPGPCPPCRKAADSISLAKHICIRQTLLELRFGETSFDFLSQCYTEELLQTEIGAFHGKKRTIACNLLFRGTDTITRRPLLLEVQDYSVSYANAPPLVSDCLVGYNKSTPIFRRVTSERYALTPESLPTVRQLLGWIQLDVHSPNESTVKRFMLSLGEFMERYCAEQPDVPMYEMLNSAVTILKLLRCWRNCKMTNSPDPSSTQSPLDLNRNKQHISRTVVSQLLLIIKDGIRTAELTLLDNLEKLVYSTKGPGQKNMIPLWTTLWTLVLTYRDCMTAYKFSQHCSTTISFEHDAADAEVLIEASKHMYHILTSVYAALFRASTPLYLDWREGSNMELLGNSEVLKGAFIALRTEVEWFYGQKHRLGNEDARLKDEIIEQEQRLKPKYPTNVVARRRVQPSRAEDNVVSICLASVDCHFDH